MFCKNCGAKLEDGALFCPKCGAAVQRVNNSWENVQQDQARQEPPHPFRNEPMEEPAADQANERFVQPAPSPVFVPVQPQPDAPRKQKPAKGKRSKLPLIILGVVAGVVAAGGIAFGMVQNNPKNVLVRAAVNTYRAVVSEETGVSGYLGLKDLAKAMREGKTRQTLSGEVDLAALDLGLPEGTAKVTVTADTDAGKEFYLNSEISGLGINWQLAELSCSQDALLAAAPQLYDRSFYLDLAKLKEMILSGELFTKLEESYGLEIEENAKNAVQEAITGEKPEMTEAAAAYEAYLNDVWGILKNGIKVTKADAVTFSIGGTDTSCKGYAVTVAASDLLAIVDRTETYLAEEMIPYMESVYEAAGQEEDLADAVHEAVAEAKAEITEDLQLIAYVGPQKRLIALAWDGDVSVSDTTASLALVVRMAGAKNPMDDMGLALTVTGEGDASTMELNRLLTDTDSQIADQWSLTIDDQDVLVMEGSLDKNSGGWEIAMDSDSASTVVLRGTLQDVEPGRSFTLAVTDLEADMETFSDGMAGASYETVSMADYGLVLTYRLEPIDALNSGSIASMERLDLLEAGPEDFEEVSTAVQNNLMGLVMQLMGAVGFGGF